MADDPLKDAHTRIVAAIAELRQMGVPVPLALLRAVEALRKRPKVLPFFRKGER
jgi:hypothetical protein